MPFCLDLYAVSAQLGKDHVDAALLDRPHRLGRHAQRDPALFSFDPESLLMQVWQEASSLSIVSVRDAVPDRRVLTGDFADSGHIKP